MKKVLSLMIAAIMIFACVPAAVFAAGPKSITGVEITALPELYEGTRGELKNAYDPVTGAYLGAYFEYDASPDEVKISFADGTSKTVTSDYDCYLATGSFWAVTTDQTFNDPWEIGYHTATLTVGSYTLDYTVTVIPMTIKGVEVEDITLIEGVDGYETLDYDQNSGDFLQYYRYSFWGAKARVVLGDDTTCEIYSGYEDHGVWGDLLFADDQTPSTPWGVGEHEARAYLLGKWCDFKVNVVPNPFEDVEFRDVTVMKRINSTTEPGFRYYMYNCDFTVTLTDGTKIDSTDGYICYNGQYLYPHVEDGQFVDHWTGENELGDHAVKCEFCGLSGTMTVTVVDPHYSRMSVREDEKTDLYLQFWKNSEEYDEFLVEDFVYSGEDEYAWIMAQISVGGNPAMAKCHCSHDPSGIPYYEYDFEIDVGEDFVYDSGERLFDVYWLKRQMMLPAYAGYTFVQPYFDPQFNGYTPTSYDIDTVIMLACNIRGCFDEFDEVGWDGEYAYAFLEKRVILEAVQYVFGLDIEDEIQNYKYWPQDPEWQNSIRVNKSSVTDYIKDLGYDGTLDNTYHRYMTTLYEGNGESSRIRFRLRGDLTIDAIFFLGPVSPEPVYLQGDTDGDGAVTMKDTLYLRRVLAGAAASEPGDEARLDVDGDGKVTMKDVLLLRKILAGAV